MAGGPVNGVPFFKTDELAKKVASAAGYNIEDRAPDYNISGIIIPTVLQMASDALRYWTGVTCLYDRYWESGDDKLTLPVSFFHVKKITPTRTVDTS